MSGLNGKHLARVNQQLSGQPSRAPDGCAQLAGAAFPAELTVREPSPWLAAQCPTFVVAKTFLQATAGGCLLLSHCFGVMLERARQEGGTTAWRPHGEGLSCRVGTGRWSLSE